MKRAAMLCIALALAPRPARANPVDLFGFGARAPAMGGAGTAATNDAGANYYNPAAIALQTGLRIDFGYQYAQPTLRMNGASQNVEESRGLSLGLVLPGKLGGSDVAFGAGLFLPDQSVLTSRTLSAEQPRWALYDNRPRRIFFGAHAALRITDTIFAGAGVGTMAATEGRYVLGGLLGFPVPDDSALVLDVDVDATSAIYPQAGLLWMPTPWLRVGLAYRGEFVLEAVQVVRFEADVGSPGNVAVENAIVDIESVSLDFFQPAQLAAGIAAQVAPRVLLSFDVVYQRWSRFDNPTPRIDIELDVGQFNDLVMLDEPPELEAPGFSDIMSVHLGTEILTYRSRRSTVHVRAGYAYAPSPAPEQVRSSNFIDNARHTLSAGLGSEVRDVTSLLPRPFTVDLSVSYTAMAERRHRKLSAADPVGDITSSGHIVTGSVTTSWAF